MTSSGRPFELMEVRVVDELGGNVAKDGQQARAAARRRRSAPVQQGVWRGSVVSTPRCCAGRFPAHQTLIALTCLV